MKKAKLLLLLLPYLLGACSPKVSTTITSSYGPVDYRENVWVFSLHEAVPPQAEKLGTVRISDTGFTIDCSWEVVIERARTEARKAGGNALKIVNHTPPNLGSTCHRITALILKLDLNDPAVAGDKAVTNPEILTDTTLLAEEYFTKPAPNYQEGTYTIDFPKFRAGIYGGWSSRIGRVSEDLQPDFQEYIQDLKKGYHIGADAAYFMTEQMGLGLKYSNYKASNSMNIYTELPNGTIQTGIMSDMIAINFLAPTMNLRYYDPGEKNSLHMSFGLGYLGYRDNSVVLTDKLDITGGTLGLSWDLGCDIGLTKNTALGLQLSFIAGALSKVNVKNGFSTHSIKLDQENMENLSRIDLSVGFRFIK